MARQSISQARSHQDAINSGVLDLMGDEQSDYRVINLESISDTLAYIGVLYAKKLRDNLDQKNISSSGGLGESIIPLDVTMFGSIYTVEIEAAKFAKFIDEGVNGWAKNRGSRFTFKGGKSSGKRKGGGARPLTEMQKSVKAWLLREGNVGRIKNRPTTQREARQMSITSATDKAAISAAFMIKRQGIKPTHFWRDATKEMRSIVEIELGKALKVDIINSITV